MFQAQSRGGCSGFVLLHQAKSGQEVGFDKHAGKGLGVSMKVCGFTCLRFRVPTPKPSVEGKRKYPKP